MIQITDKYNCCGCEACLQRCPKECISMSMDSEGFLYPSVDTDKCIDCGLCEKVCPVQHKNNAHEPLKTFVAKNPDEEIRLQSSSGGIFSLLAEAVIREGGVVFGAQWNDSWECVHGLAEEAVGIAAFRGSKYLQSSINGTYKKAEYILKQGRKVLFSGTPCQIAGLRRYLRREYDNLLLVDFICHGVPSPGVFRQYLKEEMEKVARQGRQKNTVSSSPIHPVSESDTPYSFSAIRSITFRDKRKGWKKYSFALSLSKASADGEENTVSLSYSLGKHAFMRGFLKDLYLRPSCYACPSKGLSSGADITLGDFWGIDTLHPELDDDRGLSAVTVNTERGLAALSATTAELHEVEFSELKKRNPALVRSAVIPIHREAFFTDDGRTFHEKINQLCQLQPIVLRILTRIFHIFTYNNLKR